MFTSSGLQTPFKDFVFDTDDHEYGLNFKFESKNNFFEDFSTPKFFEFFSIFFTKI